MLTVGCASAVSPSRHLRARSVGRHRHLFDLDGYQAHAAITALLAWHHRIRGVAPSFAPGSTHTPPSWDVRVLQNPQVEAFTEIGSETRWTTSSIQGYAVRRGRLTSSPAQLGQRFSSSPPQFVQNVHSKLQITATPSAASGASHRSQDSRISSINLLFRIQ